MGSEDVTTRLLAAIEAVEKDARAATQGAWNARLWPGLGTGDVENEDRSGFVVYDSGGAGACELADAVHIARQNPKSTLIRCQADQKIVDSYRYLQKAMEEGPVGARAFVRAALDVYEAVIGVVAEGYGLTTVEAPDEHHDH